MRRVISLSLSRNFSSGVTPVRVGTQLNRIHLQPGKWEDYTSQTKKIASDFEKAKKDVASGVYYGIVNMGTRPASAHTDVISFINFKDAMAAQQGLEFESETRTKLVSQFMTEPPVRQLCDGVQYHYSTLANEGHQATAAVGVSVIHCPPGSQGELLNHLMNSPAPAFEKCLLLSAFARRSTSLSGPAHSDVSLFAFYKTFRAALKDADAQQEWLRGLQRFSQHKEAHPTSFVVHEWGQIYSRD